MKLKTITAAILTLSSIYGLLACGINTIKSTDKLKNEISIKLNDDVNIELVYIDEGTFYMGSLEEGGDGDETPRHKVEITKPFYMSKYEITQRQWDAIMKSNNSIFKGDNNPVDNVSFNECINFIEEINKKVSYKGKISLPTEAQWEYACRAGSDTAWFFGNNEDKCEDYGWIGSNSDMKTHEVGLKKPNDFGLYDMYGNVQEWCSDWYKNPYDQNSIVDPQGPESGDSKVIRGGAWGDSAEYARSAYRNANGCDVANDGTGFRIVINME